MTSPNTAAFDSPRGLEGREKSCHISYRCGWAGRGWAGGTGEARVITTPGGVVG